MLSTGTAARSTSPWGSAPVVNLPNVVVLYDPDGAVRIVGDEALAPSADEPRLWACQAWEALANVGKYARRSSYWEALGQLNEARANVFRPMGAGRAGTSGPLWHHRPCRCWSQHAARHRQVHRRDKAWAMSSVLPAFWPNFSYDCSSLLTKQQGLRAA